LKGSLYDPLSLYRIAVIFHGNCAWVVTIKDIALAVALTTSYFFIPIFSNFYLTASEGGAVACTITGES
jgi:hypothetical protein